MPRPTAAPPASAYRRAILRLARRDHTAAELRRVLAAKGHPGAEIAEAIERLRREKYLDDARYAERFARSRLADHGLGPARVRHALRQRGVDRGTTEDGIRAATREVDQGMVLDALARRYWRQHLRVEPARRLPRLWGFLLRRGFAPDLVRNRLAELWPRLSSRVSELEPPPDDAATFSPDDRAPRHQHTANHPGDDC